MLNKDNLKDHNINTACVATRGLHYAYGLQKTLAKVAMYVQKDM